VRRPRLTVFVRLLLTLAAVAALPTLVVMAVQGRALERDLEGAAVARLERARHAAARLLDAHVAGLAQRIRAVSGTPQFRATLELGDAATLRFYAAELARREGVSAVAFVSGAGEVSGGDAPELIAAARAALPRAIFARDEQAFVAARVPLRTGDLEVGELFAVEPLSAERLGEWSDTCGATLALARAAAPARERLARVVRSVGELDLVVWTSLDAERAALAHARRNLAAAGAVALGWRWPRACSSRAASCARSSRCGAPPSGSGAATSAVASPVAGPTRSVTWRAPSTTCSARSPSACASCARAASGSPARSAWRGWGAGASTPRRASPRSPTSCSRSSASSAVSGRARSRS
jgi:hypothetical protein